MFLPKTRFIETTLRSPLLRFAKDRPALEAAIAKIAGLDFLHVIPSHGEAVLNEGKPRLLAAFRERRLLA